MTRSRDAATRLPTVLPPLCALLAAGAFLSACSLPVSLPMPSIAGAAEPVEVTGTVSTEVDDEGFAESVGSRAWAALKAALVSAAEHGEDGETFAWKDPESVGGRYSEGTVTAVDAFFDETGAVCRRLAITATAYQREDAFAAEACRRDGGGWTVKPVSGR